MNLLPLSVILSRPYSSISFSISPSSIILADQGIPEMRIEFFPFSEHLQLIMLESG